MQLIKFTDLIIPENRQRKKFTEKALEDLAASIQKVGLLHPPVVRNDGQTLVAGHRRSKALAWLSHMKIPFRCGGEMIPLGMMPVLTMSELSAIELEEAELEENLIREDLTWQEEAQAMLRLTELRQKQDETWTNKDTAREVDGASRDEEPSPATYVRTRNAEILRDHLDDPDVIAAKSSKDAIKIVRRKIQEKAHAILAEVHQKSDTQHNIILGDMIKEIATLPENTFSCILTDPPYGVNAQDFGGQASNAHEYEDTPEYAMKLIETLAIEGFRVAADQAHIYVFCDIRMWPQFCEVFRRAGWDVWQTPLIWIKNNGMLPRPEHGPRRCYETILYGIKGGKKVNSVRSDTLIIPELARIQFGAEKPPALYQDLLRRSVLPGDEVLDCFAGAGPILPAANSCSVTATAIEMNEKKYNYMLLRVNERADGEPSSLEDLIGEVD